MRNTSLTLHKEVSRLDMESRGFVNGIMRDPLVYGPISDDLSPLPEDFDVGHFLSNPSVYVLQASPFTVFILHPWNSVCYEVHTICHPEGWGGQTARACKAGMEWMFVNTNCQKIVTHVPTFNRAAKALALRAGMKPEGLNSKSFLKNGVLYDQVILGITKGEVIPCPQ